MGYGSRRDLTYRIALAAYDGSANWVDIKARRSLDDRQAVEMAGMRQAGASGVAVPGMEGVAVDLATFDFEAARVALFVRSIVAWTLKADDADPEPMVLTEETFRGVLDDDFAQWLSDQIHTYYASRRPTKEAFLSLNGSSGAP